MATFGIEVEKTDKEVIYIMEVTPISLTNKYPLIDTSVPTHTQTLRKGKKIHQTTERREKNQNEFYDLSFFCVSLTSRLILYSLNIY